METNKQITYYHTSNPKFRQDILKNGLIPKQDSWGQAIGSDMNKELGTTKAIFIISGKPYYSCYDDDIYEVDISNLKNDFFEDKYVSDSLYTLTPIPLTNLKLIKKGSGKCLE